MSHFTVLIIGDNIEEQLAPFDENMEVAPHPDTYYTPEQMIEDLERAASRIRNPEDGEEEAPSYFQWAVPIVDDIEDVVRIFKMGGWSFIQKKKQYLDTIKTYLREYVELSEDRIQEDGTPLTTYNPDSKWDWYSIGGRWTGFFKLKANAGEKAVVGNPGLMTEPAPPGYADQCRIGDIDIEGTRKTAYDNACKAYDEAFEKFTNDQDKAEGMRDFMYGVKPEDTKESYAQRAADSALMTFAVLKDGKWYERGSMGWWGCVSDEKDTDEWTSQFNALIDGLPEDTIVSVVDCHI